MDPAAHGLGRSKGRNQGRESRPERGAYGKNKWKWFTGEGQIPLQQKAFPRAENPAARLRNLPRAQRRSRKSTRGLGPRRARNTPEESQGRQETRSSDSLVAAIRSPIPQ